MTIHDDFDKLKHLNWTMQRIHAGTPFTVVAALRVFADEIERECALRPDEEIAIDCRAGARGTFRMRKLSELDS